MTTKLTARAHAAAAGSLLACFAMAAPAAPVDAGKPGETVTTGKPSRYGGPTQFRPTFSVPSLKTEFAIGGFVKFDAVYDMDYNTGGALNPFTLSQARETDGRIDGFVYESRLNFRSGTDTDFGRLDTVFEFDLWPDNEFNLRQAYATVNNWLFGHTWSNAWMTIGSLEDIKYGGVMGSSFGVRHSQVRYTMDLPNKNHFSVSLEEPTEVPIAMQGVASGSFESKLPVLTARYEMGRRIGISAMVRQLEVTEDAAAAADESVVGYAINLQAAYPILKSTSLRFSGIWGEGFASYIPGGATAGPTSLRDAYVDADGDLEPVELTAIQLGLAHAWNARTRSTIGYARVEQDEVPGAARLTDVAQYGFANVFWSPVPRVDWGIEYQWGDIELHSGEQRDASRIQATAIVQF